MIFLFFEPYFSRINSPRLNTTNSGVERLAEVIDLVGNGKTGRINLMLNNSRSIYFSE